MKVNTFLPIFSGFYGSVWDEQDFYGEDEYYNLPADKSFDDFVDWSAYHEHIAKEMCSEVESLLSDFVKGITFQSISSPKYYNFGNDSINCEVDIQEAKVHFYLDENIDAFAKYIKDRYTSRDGFISYYSNNYLDWLTEWSIDEHMVGAVLEFICENEGMEEPYDLADCYISLFFTNEINEYAAESE